MHSSDKPSQYTKKFAASGSKNSIPVDSSSTESSGNATFEVGFPDFTMKAISAGGMPPQGKDFNGILNSITIKQQ